MIWYNVGMTVETNRSSVYINQGSERRLDKALLFGLVEDDGQVLGCLGEMWSDDPDEPMLDMKALGELYKENSNLAERVTRVYGEFLGKRLQRRVG